MLCVLLTQVVLLDEAHERTVNTDVLLGLLKGLLARRPDDFRLIVMSATLDAAPMSTYFGGARVAYVKVSSRGMIHDFQGAPVYVNEFSGDSSLCHPQ